MSDKKLTTQFLRLKEKHPTAVKLSKLLALADELGIYICFDRFATIVIDKDRDEKLPPIYMEDLENGDPVKEFPAELEYRLIYENPVWAKEQQLKFEELQKKQSEEVAARKAKKEAEELERKEAAARETERRERALLVELKAKYENA